MQVTSYVIPLISFWYLRISKVGSFPGLWKTLVVTEPSRFLLKAVSRNLVGLVSTVNLIFGWCEFIFWNNSSKSVFFFLLEIVCVCVCVYVCVCVCLYSSTVKASSVWKMSKTYLRVRINDLVLWIFVDWLCQVLSSPCLKMSYFTSKDENSSRPPTGEKTIWYNALREKMIFIDIGYKSALVKPPSYEKILKIRKLL